MLLLGTFMGWLKPAALIKLLARKDNALSLEGGKQKGEGERD